MDIDLPYILFWAVCATGLIWLVDVALFRRKRRQKSQSMGTDQQQPVADPVLVEYASSLFPVLLLVLILRGFVAEPYQIPSESMVPTLEVGDFILVSKYAYGLRLPVFGSKILEVGDPQRGDVMVFVPPHDPRYFIKRVIGIPGDHVRYENKALFINGERLQYELVGEVENSQLPPGSRIRFREYRETIDGRIHSIIKHNGRSSRDGSREWHIPEGKYLMLGDNRDRSEDSRVWGYASEENIVGKAIAIWLHNEPGWTWPNFSRNRWFDDDEDVQVSNKTD